MFKSACTRINGRCGVELLPRVQHHPQLTDSFRIVWVRLRGSQRARGAIAARDTAG